MPLTAAVTDKIDERQEGDRCSRTFTDHHGQIRNYLDGNGQAEMTGAGMVEKEPLIPKHGGYRKLKSFQVAQLVYDVTVRFCELYVDQFSRTRDQMVQAARSGVQNIAEGSQASATSRKTELKLTNVSRASLEELRLDYEDFLRQRGLPVLSPDHPALVRFKRRRKVLRRRVASPNAFTGCGQPGGGATDALDEESSRPLFDGNLIQRDSPTWNRRP